MSRKRTFAILLDLEKNGLDSEKFWKYTKDMWGVQSRKSLDERQWLVLSNRLAEIQNDRSQLPKLIQTVEDHNKANIESELEVIEENEMTDEEIEIHMKEDLEISLPDYDEMLSGEKKKQIIPNTINKKIQADREHRFESNPKDIYKARDSFVSKYKDQIIGYLGAGVSSNKEKYGIRIYVNNRDTCGINMTDFHDYPLHIIDSGEFHMFLTRGGWKFNRDALERKV